METVDAIKLAVENIRDVVESGFINPIREQHYIHKILDQNHISDQKRYKMIRVVYKIQIKLEPADLYHLIKLID